MLNYTRSQRAWKILASMAEVRRALLKVMPNDYKRVLISP
jgi:glutamate synthase domain-containing protein 3